MQEDEWIYMPNFGYIHRRMLGTCFNSHVKVFESAFKHLRPGGWFKMQDLGFPFRWIDESMKDTAFERWLEAIQAGCRKLGKDLGRAAIYVKYMLDCGFMIYRCDAKRIRVANWKLGKK